VSDLLQVNVYPNLTPSASVEKQRTTVQLISAVTRQAPIHITPALDKIVPGVLKAVEKDDEELRESSLQALETFLIRCPAEITPFTQAIVQVALQYIKYDPVSDVLSVLFYLSPDILVELCWR
jgi:cullin-associated NEDD8-dissociated protein 1